MGLLDHTVVLFLVFKGLSIIFPLVDVSTYIPTISVKGLLFSPHHLLHLVSVDVLSESFLVYVSMSSLAHLSPEMCLLSLFSCIIPILVVPIT